ncbi:hypothetical protein Zmor_008669 [Zophobas morio]|uniref:Triosephosphate isomerase n=1 Tax=Zophobas morio TaxID=2755281 RepID=A0AA38HMA8_9CUCU|nr:hypothetical protein Zmor_008669 [Zophobas morio]
MFKTNTEALAFINEVDGKVKANDNMLAGVAVPFTALSDVKKASKNLIIAAENCHFKENGAYTGEISIPMLQDLKVSHVVIGHSERREMFNETNETVNLKAKALLAANMTPILCCGETLETYEAGKTVE